jgi:hypothetical protein
MFYPPTNYMLTVKLQSFDFDYLICQDLCHNSGKNENF